MFCPKCGTQAPDAGRFCAACGQPLNATSSERLTVGAPSSSPPQLVYPRNPPLSPHLCWVNIVFGGLAQIIHGQVAKGLVLLVAMMIAYATVPVVGNIPICIISIIDAYMVGKTLRAGQPVQKWQWFPSSK